MEQWRSHPGVAFDRVTRDADHERMGREHLSRGASLVGRST
jgi:hypothetical protein